MADNFVGNDINSPANFAALEPDQRQITHGFPASVLMLVDSWSSGGLENLIVDLSHSLAARGTSIFVAVANGPPPPSSSFAANSRIRTLSFGGDEAAFGVFLRREPVDLVNYHHSLFAIDSARRQAIGSVYTMHSCYLWMDDHARAQVALGLAKMDAVIAVSRQVAHFAQIQFRCPAEKITVIGNGLRIDALPPAERPAVARGIPFTVAIVGSLHRLKLQHVAVAAFCRAADEIPELRLRLIGAPLDRAYYAELQTRISASRHRHRIELIPGLSRADTLAALARAHLFVSASSLEGYGLALVEAAAAGCVCITTDVGCARELRVDGGAILVIPSPLGELDYITQPLFYAAIASELPRHRDALAEMIGRAWREYPSFAAGVPKTRARLRELCGMQQMTEGYLRVYGAAHRQAGVSPITAAAAEVKYQSEAREAEPIAGSRAGRATTQTNVKRVLIPVYWMTDFGGLHENVRDTAEALIAGGWQVTVMAPPNQSSVKFAAAGAQVVDDSMEDRDASISLALSHGPFDLVHAHPFQARRIGAAVAQAQGIPLVVTIHGQYDDEFDQYGPAVQRVICVSPRIAEFIGQVSPRLTGRLVVIPNGVDFTVFSPPARARATTEKKIIAVASRLDPDKGVLSQVIADLIDYLVETGSPHQFELRIAGERFYGPPDNPFTEAIGRAAASEAVDVVRAGWISERRALRQFFVDADVVLAPGRAAMEAVACETPTIAAASRGYVGLVTTRRLALAHATNFGGVRDDATIYSPGAVIAHFHAALLMTRTETAELRKGLQKLHDLRSIQTTQLELCDGLFATYPHRDNFPGTKINSVDYWNKRFFEDWIAKGGRQQTAFFAELCCRELPEWLVEELRARKSSIFDYGCALGDALPVWQRAFPQSTICGGDVAQVGLGLARALHPGFEFADINALGESRKVADIVYCSNTLEHFENWREILHRLSRHAKEYILVVVPFEEEDRIDEHFCTFEFGSLPARLPGGSSLLHLGVVDAGAEPATPWHGLQLIAIYGKDRRGRDLGSAGSLAQPRNGSLVFDLRGVKPPALPSLLASLAAMSHAKRQIARDLGEAHKLAQAEAAARADAARRIDELETDRARLNAAVREYADLTRGMEDAQRWLLAVLTDLDPELISNRQISPVPEGWPANLPDDIAAHRATLARLIEAVHRTNRVGLAFHAQASRWQAQRGDLTRRIQQARRAMEKAVGERDRAYGRALAVPEIGDANRTGSEADFVTITRAAPLVSIVLPVYNQADLVDEAIAGVVSQTYENWELIVLDDGSTDDLQTRVRHYLGERRVLFLRQPNQKLPAALNQGFAYARGDLLTWTSADNIMLPAQLERLVAELAAHPDAGLVYSDYWAIDYNGRPLDDPSWRPHNRSLEIPDLIRLPSEVTIESFHRSGDDFIGASFLYRRSVADIVGWYADDAFGGEDYDFWLRMHLVTEFHHIAEPLYKYRVHDNTLTARAEELGIFANIREFLEADRWRIDTLLTDGVLRSGGSLLRPADQFHAAILKRCRPVPYGGLAEHDPAAEPEGPSIVDIDVPARAIDAAVLRHADILLCRSDLTAALLRREDWARGKRILTWSGELTPAVQHAFIQAFAEQVTKPVTAPVRRVPARIDDPFRPARILLMVDRWSTGGLENVLIGLAQSLVAKGRTVFVASAKDAPPPAAAFGAMRIPTFSFRDDESGFEAFLRRKEIEVVNYHHSRFGVEHAKQQGVATVYTMHNSYLWMDESARQKVAAGLAGMDRVIAVSRQVAQFAVAQFGFPGDRIVVVANGLRDEIIAPATRSAGDDGTPFTVAMVASLVRPKLQHIAITAFAEAAQDIPEMRLRLIGAPVDQLYHRELEAQIAASPQGHRIELIAGLTRIETIAALAGAHVFLLPSLVEGCSVALLEAAAAGCVCIASDVGSARDLHVSGGSVVLLPSPLGELESVTQQQFVAATASELPEHRANIAQALRNVRRDYGSFAAGVAETRARLRELSGMQQMTDAYLLAYTMARRGGDRARRKVAAESAPATSVGAVAP